MSIKKLLKWFYEYWLRHKYRMILIIILGITAAYFQAAMPFYIRKIINGFEFNQTREYLLKNVFILLMLGFINFAVNLFAQRNRAYMNYRIEYEIRKKTFEHILTLDEFFLYRFSQGDIVTRLIDDISEKIAWFSCSGVFRFIQAVFTLVAIISVMIYINPELTAVALLPMPIMVITIIKLGHILTKRYDELQKSISKVYDYLETSFGGIKSIRANMKEKKFSEKFNIITLAQMEKSANSEKLQVLVHYIFFFTASFGIFLVYLIGGINVIDGKITVGDLVSFQVYVFMIIWPFSDVSQFFITAKRAGASVARIDEILKFKQTLKINNQPPKINDFRSIKLKKIKFSIDNKFIIDGVDIDIKKGEKIAIVGMVGSGKSTLLKIIARLIQYNSGYFTVDDKDISDIDLSSYYSLTGYVPQEPIIFSDSILNNITMYHDFSEREIETVLGIVDLYKDISSMPDGIKTYIGTRGATVSGGQKQRISLARAILKKPNLLILDDATSQIDVKTENHIWNELVKMDITVVFTTHRTSLLQKADRIYVIDKGKVVETGNHFELISSDTLYSRIYRELK